MLIVPKRKWWYPLAVEREYAKLLVAYVDREMAIVEGFLPEMADAVFRNGIRTDGIGDWLGNLVDRIGKKIKSTISAVSSIGKVFKQVSQHVSRQLTETFESLFGSRPRQLATRELEMTKTIWTSQNLTLIKSIDQQILDRIRFAMSQRIIRTADREQTMEALADDIQRIAGNARNRAVLIAVDQVGKLNSQLTQYRQMNAGIEEYVWNTMKDSRVRLEHRARDGQVYKWSEPPADGHPGWPIRCRCTALPVLDTDKIGLEPRRNAFTRAPEDGIIKADKVISSSEAIPRKFEPNGIIDSVDKDGNRNRTFYGADGIMVRQIHSTGHGNPKTHPYGTHGEHAHDYVWAPDGKRMVQRKTGNLTQQQREENSDLL